MLGNLTRNRLCYARKRLRQIYEKRPSIREVAKEAKMSPYHFIRLFKAVFGETPYQYHVTARLEEAKLLLLFGDDSVTDICMQLGFSSLGSFSYLFSRHIGISPSAYRKEFQPQIKTPGKLPESLMPGCFSLLGGSPSK